jgi:high-affinity K+ transport system ATPase subunit B
MAFHINAMDVKALLLTRAAMTDFSIAFAENYFGGLPCVMLLILALRSCVSGVLSRSTRSSQ